MSRKLTRRLPVAGTVTLSFTAYDVAARAAYDAATPESARHWNSLGLIEQARWRAVSYAVLEHVTARLTGG